MAQAALEAVPEILDMELAMPNKHCLLVDLSRFGQTNPNQIFVPTDEPYGNIVARIRREVNVRTCVSVPQITLRLSQMWASPPGVARPW